MRARMTFVVFLWGSWQLKFSSFFPIRPLQQGAKSILLCLRTVLGMLGQYSLPLFTSLCG